MSWSMEFIPWSNSAYPQWVVLDLVKIRTGFDLVVYEKQTHSLGALYDRILVGPMAEKNP